MRHITGPRPTTFVESVALSEHLGTRVVLASETFQWTGSFKFRAAYHVASHIDHSRVIAASSGNFGQAMALSCRLLGKRCTVVMPVTTPRIKVDAARAYGATVDLVDTKVITRQARVAQLAAEDPEAYVASPSDDPFVISGNASLGREIARQSFDVVISPIGGGGLASGLITGLQEAGSKTAVWGAEPALANDFVRSFQSRQLVTNAQESLTIADGVRTLSVGQKYNWPILQSGIAGAVEVSETSILEGTRLLFSLANLKAEPTGAVALAAVLTDPARFVGRSVCCVVTGGNVDPTWYAKHIVEQA